MLDSDGQRLADVLHEKAARREAVVLSFRGLRHVTTAFLHAALGAVLLHHSDFAELLRVEGAESAMIEAKIADVQRMALDADYRQQMQQAWAEEMA